MKKIVDIKQKLGGVNHVVHFQWLRYFFTVTAVGWAMVLHGQAFTESNLPIVIIQTGGQVIADEPKITADMKIIYNGPGKINRQTDPPGHYNGKIGIELRGSSSMDFPKKPYGFETRDTDGENRNVSLLGMPEENDWILNASYNDKTLMRDALAYLIAGKLMSYAPRVRHVELVINNQYQGVYLLTEKIKRDKNRVDISNMDVNDNDGNALTGGYIFKIDKETGSNSGQGWISPYKPEPGVWQQTFFQYEFPDVKEITNAQKNYIQQHVTKLDHVMAGAGYDDPITGYRAWVDAGSIADFIIVNELTKNPDAYRLSTFFYKKRDSQGGKIVAGPVWDFNLGFGNVNYCTNGDPEGLVIRRFNQVCPGDYWLIHFWWKKWMDDQKMENEIKARWQNLRGNELAEDRLEYVVDSLAALLSLPQRRNFTKWPVLGQYVWPNYFVGATYEQEVQFLKQWIRDRIGYLDSIWGRPVQTDDPESGEVTVYPNPSEGTFRIISGNSGKTLTRVTLTDITGKNYDVSFTRVADNEYEIHSPVLTPSCYVLRLETRHQTLLKRVVIQP